MTDDVSLKNWQQPYLTLCEMFEAASAAHGDKPYISTAAGDLSYAQVFTVVDHLSREWESAIAGRDVAVYLPNSASFPVCYFAILRAGGRPALINVGMPETAVVRLLNDLNPAMTYSQESVAGFATCILSDETVYELATSLEPINITPSLARPSDIGAILFSGGTTGLPKRIRYEHRTIMAMVERIEWCWRTVSNEIWLPVAPFTHVYGYLMGVTNPVLRGGKLVIPPQFHPDIVMDLLESQKVGVFGGGPPAIYQALMSAKRFSQADLSSLRVCPGGGASFPDAVHTRWEQSTGLKIYEGIGMTEIAPTAANSEHSGTKLGTAGKPTPDTIIEIVDLETGNTKLPPQETGEIRVKGPHMMTGYDNNPEETANTIRDGFIYTGDIGLLDDDGFLRITDRKKDVIFYKGFNVFPREVEEILMEHASVLEAAVVGREDKRAGEVPVAFVKTSDAIEANELLAHCERLLTDYKVPKTVVLLEEIPLTPARKIDRTALRMQARNQ